MAAEFIEDIEASTEGTSDLPEDPQQASPEQIAQDFTPVDSTEEPEADLPEKYRGKSTRELIAMHQETERWAGTQSAEIGDLRQVVDQYIQSNLQSQAQPEPEPEEQVDFFEDPDKAVQRAIDRHPTVQKANQAAQNFQQQTAMTTLQQRHPDMAEVMADPAFVNWVKDSQVRTAMFVEADQNYNAVVADELFTLWKDRQNMVQQTQQVETQARKQQVKAAATGNTGGGGNAPTKRIYRRADVIKLMKTDPERYEALSGELMQAYRDGRVR